MSYDIDLEKIGRNIFPFYLTILFIAPIPFGSNRPWAWAILAIISCLLLFIYLWNYARQNIRPPELTSDIKITFVLLFFWLLYQVFQLVPLPIEILQTLSPRTFHIKQAAFGIEEVTHIPLSFDISTGLHSIYKTVLYISIFVLTICLVQSRDRLRSLILTIVFMGVAQAVLGMSTVFIEENVLAVSESKNILNVVTGTFINRNHFGGFMNLSIAAALALLLASGLKEKRKIHREKLTHHWQSRVLDWRVYLIPYLGFMVVALIFSESRGAMFSCVMMLLIMFFCFLYMKIGIDDIYNSFKFPIWLLGFAIVLSGAEILSERFTMLDEDMVIRMAHWKNSILIIKDFTFFGVGSGSFQHIYPLYDTGVDKHRLLHAHNDYLELLVEQGIVGFSFLALIVIISIKNAFQAVKKFSNLHQSAFAIASLIAICGFLIHSTMDFNFQIPSNAIYFFVFLAIALLQGMESIHVESRDTVWDEEAFTGSMRAVINK